MPFDQLNLQWNKMEYIASEYHVDLPVFQSPMEKYKILFCTQNDQYYIFNVPVFNKTHDSAHKWEKCCGATSWLYVKVAFPQIVFLKQF